MNQFGPSALINLSNFSSIKPEPASTPPQGSMANSTAVVKIPGTPGAGGRLSPENNQVLTKKKLQDLVREVDPNEQLDEDVEEMLLQIADDFIESVVTAACQLARHRKSSTLEVKDVQLHLERQWNMWIPGFGSEEIRPYKKACTTEAHKQMLLLWAGIMCLPLTAVKSRCQLTSAMTSATDSLCNLGRLGAVRGWKQLRQPLQSDSEEDGKPCSSHTRKLTGPRAAKA
uniref:Transcription initiation factor TFIID subunit 12 n=1 Tax=Homo sapiens TaxID=9606 RepID=A0A8I5KTB6_HUMAN